MKLDKYDIAYIVCMLFLTITCSAIVGGVAVESCYGDPKSPLCEEVNK
jgi:hypothetical protein